MDYEKLHKDTINKLQQMVNSGKITVKTACGICADFVPENEDEVMIKFIKNQLFNIKKTITENYELDAKLTKAIDWLEKQGNLIKALQISNANIGELVEKNYYLKEQLEKQGKNNMGISEATKQKLEDNLNKALEKETRESWNEFLDKQGEQKSAWSEEDEHIINLTIHHLSTYERIGSVKKCISWLKYLKDRILPQQKQEWSEKDERMFKNTIALIETIEDYNKAPDGFGDVKFWLKSLKERYTWKPSEEQMKALKETVDEHFDIDGGALWHLYEQLKKLREE